MNNIKELLTFEIYIKQGIYFISIPVNNLIRPHFLLKDNNLFIFIYSYSSAYIVKNLTSDVLEAIKNKNCYLLENLDQEKQMEHHIKLFP